jgi:hypothetical protein
MSDEIPKLRMTAPESAEEIERRLRRDQTTVDREREVDLEQSLAGFRVGSVRFLNGVPLTRGLEDQIFYDVPSKLAAMLEKEELDAALVSVTEVLFWTAWRLHRWGKLKVSSLRTANRWGRFAKCFATRRP